MIKNIQQIRFRSISLVALILLLGIGINRQVYAFYWLPIKVGKAVPVQVTSVIDDTITRTYIYGYATTDCSGGASTSFADTAPTVPFSIASGTHSYFLGVTPNGDSTCTAPFTSVPCLLCPGGTTVGSIKFNFVTATSQTCTPVGCATVTSCSATGVPEGNPISTLTLNCS